MSTAAHHEVSKIWQQLLNTDVHQSIKSDINDYIRQVNVFMPGESYYYLFALPKGNFEMVSDKIEKVLGYHPSEVDVPFIIDKMHPEDQPWFVRFENHIAQFFSKLTLQQVPNYKVRYDYRIRKKNGEYIRILQQVITVEFSKENPVVKTFGVHSDISYLKMDGKPVLSIIGYNGEPSYIDIMV